MNRRRFIKTGLIFVPASFAGRKLLAQTPGVNSPFIGGFNRTPAAAGGSCAETYTNDATTASTSFGGGNYYWGQASWQRPAAITICRLEFELLGNGSSRNWFVAIYTMSGINLNLAGQQAVSAAIPGANWASATWFGGDLTTPFAPSAATNYALVLFPETALGGNDITSYLDGTTLAGGGNREVFSAAGAAGFAGGNDCSIKIFTQ